MVNRFPGSCDSTYSWDSSSDCQKDKARASLGYAAAPQPQPPPRLATPERGFQLVFHDGVLYTPAPLASAAAVVALPTTNQVLPPLPSEFPPKPWKDALTKRTCTDGANDSRSIPRPERRSYKRSLRRGAIAAAASVVAWLMAAVFQASRGRTRSEDEHVTAANVDSGGNATRGNGPGRVCSTVGRTTPSTSAATAEECRPGNETDGVSEGPEETRHWHRGTAEAAAVGLHDGAWGPRRRRSRCKSQGVPDGGCYRAAPSKL